MTTRSLASTCHLLGRSARLAPRCTAYAASTTRSQLSSRYFSSSHRSSSAQLQNILASEDDPVRIQVDKLTPRGFHLTDDLLVPGGLLLIDGKPFMWDVNPPNLKAATLPEFWKDLSPDAFRIFEVVLPRPGEFQFSLKSGAMGEKLEGMAMSGRWRV